KLALSALGIDFSADDLERGLAEIPFPALDLPDALSNPAVEQLARWWEQPSDVPQSFGLSVAQSLPEMLAATAEHVFGARAIGKSIWWSDIPESGLKELHCFNQLPAHDYFVILLGEHERITSTSNL